jgi:integrase/recombinase XerD
MKPQITLFLDTRRPKAGNLYPVKLRVWDGMTKKARLFPTAFDLGENDFKQAWESKKPRREFNTLRIKLEAVKSKAHEVVEDIYPFTFDAFERKLYMRTGSGIDITYHYNQVIEDLNKFGQVGTASNYDLSLKSLMKFNDVKRGKSTASLSFYEITSEWLKEYENYMVHNNQRSFTTVSMYLRALRAIYNKAITEGEIKADIYPFGRRKYVIPSSKNTKKALSKDQLAQLLKAKPENEFQQKAKDFWFFSFACNGMNIKDIAQLKYKDIQDGAISFYRAKTINTSKGDLKTITAYLNEFTQGVIAKYGNEHNHPENFVFDILQKVFNPFQQKRAVQNFTRFINQHIKLLCKKVGLPEISTYSARHSFATMSIRNGASMEFVQESLGHGNLSTTKNYFAGFEDKTKREFAEKLMEF